MKSRQVEKNSLTLTPEEWKRLEAIAASLGIIEEFGKKFKSRTVAKLINDKYERIDSVK